VSHIFLLSSAISALVGLALMLAWRRDPAQDFSRDLGIAFLCQSAAPLGYLLWVNHPAGPLRLLGLVVMISAGVAYLSTLLLGCARLAGRQASARQALALFLSLLLLLGGLVFVDVRWPPLVSACLHVLAGMVATAWLWPRGVAERAAGLLLILIGCGQFITVVLGLDWAAAQAAGMSVLRLALGLCLLFAALQRSVERERRAQERFVNLTERSHQGVGIQRGEQVLYMNPAARRIYGVGDRAGAVAARWREATIPEADRAAARERHRALLAGELDEAQWEADRQRVDGKPLRLRFSSWRVDWDGAPAEQIVVSDITAEHSALQERLHQATHDGLTGAPNRSALLQRLHRLTPAGRPFALLLLDIDRFALINDAHGPSVGDEVLRELARRLARHCEGRAEVMRLGEDEFALLAEAADPRGAAAQLADGVRLLLAQPLPAAGLAFYLDVSMGIALHPDTAADPERLLRAANAAMHQAKRVPGTSEQLAEERFERGSGASLAAEQALRAGIERQEFFLLYQPKLRASDRRLLGFEALLRWQRGGTLVSPVDFITAAERTGLILPLGRQVLELACRQIAAWRTAGLQVVPVAVNVSRWQLLDPGFVGLLLGTLQEHGVAPQDLSIEITETAAVQDLELVRERTEALRDAGIALALDDFGSGLSSLTTLRALPLQEVKIDRGLIAPLPAADACAVVRAVCTLAGALQLSVVAEGVETEAQARALADCGCDALQGYLLARPLEPAAAAAWLQAGAQPAAA
jgi:diguanylate cyclase (GGDEF)-like protein/PAS domain S-box-containing protein